MNLNLHGWNSHVHGEFPGKFESPNLSREILSEEIGRSARDRSTLLPRAERGVRSNGEPPSDLTEGGLSLLTQNVANNTWQDKKTTTKINDNPKTAKKTPQNTLTFTLPFQTRGFDRLLTVRPRCREGGGLAFTPACTSYYY